MTSKTTTSTFNAVENEIRKVANASRVLERLRDDVGQGLNPEMDWVLDALRRDVVEMEAALNRGTSVPTAA